ncbi:hypothetical protein CCAX7_40400 [Capsulimonas corticalis]|uniref:Uncharacterized protein n=1 Tax=Capsulimonas corticalis TaxID=2219043 RepID=A0A402D4Z8_9BACT|nr:hypothetical protein [Capsulimonas corticalis]BDI31989.1 hypothetical protein CCAX7_40400 [Capsulimonas corticalis]
MPSRTRSSFRRNSCLLGAALCSLAGGAYGADIDTAPRATPSDLVAPPTTPAPVNTPVVTPPADTSAPVAPAPAPTDLNAPGTDAKPGAPPAPSGAAPTNAAPGTPSGVETPLPGANAPGFVGDEDADPNTSVILENADSFEQTTAGKWTGKGNVRVKYKQYTLNSDQVDVDLDAGEAVFTKNAVLHAPNGETVSSGPDGSLRINLRKDTYTVLNAETSIAPQRLQVGVILPVLVYGGEINGRPGLIDARGSRFTTCDFLEPHYYFLAKQLYVIPGKRLVGKNVTLYRKKRKIITLPWFVVPLDRRLSRQTLFPVVGQTPDEGYFAKFAIGYALSTTLPGILKIDAMQKKGLGLGFDQNYGETSDLKHGAGLVSLYHLADRSTGQDNISGSLNHQQQFGTVLANITSQFQQNSYLVGGSQNRSLSSQFNLSRDVGNLSTAIRTSIDTSDYGVGSSINSSTAFDQTFRPTNSEQLHTLFTLSNNSDSYTGVAANKRSELDTDIEYAQQQKQFDFQILTSKFTQLQNSQVGSTFFGGLERLPEFRLATDATRLPSLSKFLPSTTRLDLSLGSFNEPTSSTSTQRISFGLDTGSSTLKLNDRNTLNYGGSFIQRFYGDNTAEYLLTGRGDYRLKIGRNSSTGFGYNYLRPYGFTPFQFDFSGNNNTANFNYSLQESKQFHLMIATGYDFNAAKETTFGPAAPWQSVSVQMIIQPDGHFQLRTSASYDQNSHRLLDLTNYFRVRGSEGLALDVNTRYAPSQHRFSAINAQLDLPFFRDKNEDAGWRLRAIGGYNGYQNSFDYQGLALTRSWHDWEGTLIYQDTQLGIRPGRTLTFNFRLKAFPAVQPFATGQLGEALDTGLGQIY